MVLLLQMLLLLLPVYTLLRLTGRASAVAHTSDSTQNKKHFILISAEGTAMVELVFVLEADGSGGSGCCLFWFCFFTLCDLHGANYHVR